MLVLSWARPEGSRGSRTAGPGCLSSPHPPTVGVGDAGQPTSDSIYCHPVDEKVSGRRPGLEGLGGGCGGLAGSGRQVSGPGRRPALRRFPLCALPPPTSLTELRETTALPCRRRGRGGCWPGPLSHAQLCVRFPSPGSSLPSFRAAARGWAEGLGSRPGSHPKPRGASGFVRLAACVTCSPRTQRHSEADQPPQGTGRRSHRLHPAAGTASQSQNG